MEPSLVSIIVPVYNMGQQLAENANHFLDQSYQHIELILVDDGSTDHTYDICCNLAQKDPRVKVLQQKNQGSGVARNLGIELAQGKYAYFPDADDHLEQDAIGILVEEMEKEPCSLLVFGYHYINEDKTSSKKKTYPCVQLSGEEVRQHYEQCVTMHAPLAIQGAPWNKFFVMDLIKQYRIRYPDLRRNQDEVFIMRYVAHINCVRFLAQDLYGYFANNTQRMWMKFPLDYFDIVCRLHRYRMEIIYPWNPTNKAVLDALCGSFADSTNNSLLLLFNPKWNLSHQKRYQLIKQIVNRFNEELPNPHYQSQYLQYKLLRKHRYGLLYLLLLLKFKKKMN